MIAAAEADEDELVMSVPLFNCGGCSALPCFLDNCVMLVSEETVYGRITTDRKPVFFSRKFSSGVVFDTLHILSMPVCMSVQKQHRFSSINIALSTTAHILILAGEHL